MLSQLGRDHGPEESDRTGSDHSFDERDVRQKYLPSEDDKPGQHGPVLESGFGDMTTDATRQDQQTTGRNAQNLNMPSSQSPPAGPGTQKPETSAEAGRSRSQSPEGFPQRSAIPEYARTPSREKRLRATWRVKTPVLQVIDSSETPPVALFGFRTKEAPTSIAEMDNYWKQKKMLTVPIRPQRKKQPNIWVEEKEPPDHLLHWNQFTKNHSREDFLLRYSDHYKGRHPDRWSNDDVFSFVADAFIREEQVDAAGLPLSPRYLKAVGHERTESRLDVMVLNAIKSLHLDGRKFFHASAVALSHMLPLSDMEIEELKKAMAQYVELNNHHQETATAGEAMDAATQEAQETSKVEEFMLAEVRVRTSRAKLSELRTSMEPLQRRVEETRGEYQLIQGHLSLSRARTPEQQARSRPPSAALFQMQSNLRSDMEQSLGQYAAMRQEEHEMEKTVRELETASLQVRDAVNKARADRREQRAGLKAEQEQRAAEARQKQVESMSVGDQMLSDAERLLDRVRDQQAGEDRDRPLLLSKAKEKLHGARRIYEESLTMPERKRRLWAVEHLLSLEEEKRAACDRLLEVAKRHLFNANGVADSDVDLAHRSLRRARAALDSAKHAAARTGAMETVGDQLQAVEDRLAVAEGGMSGPASSQQGPSRAASSAHSVQSKRGQTGSGSRPVSRGSAMSGGGADVDQVSHTSSRVVPEAEEKEEEEAGVRNPQFEEQLTKLIHEKQKEVVEQVADSLCSMQAWLFDLKGRRKAKREKEQAALAENEVSAGSTRPHSPP